MYNCNSDICYNRLPNRQCNLMAEIECECDCGCADDICDCDDCECEHTDLD